MECLQNRLESFTKPVRVQNSSKTGAAKSIKWPHPDSFLANPTSLAEAGFYYDPSYDDRDSVTCFVCEKELGGWEADDDPFDIHYSKCAKTCCWAVVRCGLKLDLDSNGRFIFPDKSRLPVSKAMEKARLQTYSIGEGWAHDQTKSHGASSKKMAKAGFVFTPQHADDDLATCLYCGTCLSSWDSGDDPLEEHRKRKGDCPFFTGTSPPASTATTATTATKGRTSSNPARASRASTAAATHTQTRGRSRSTMQSVSDDTTDPLDLPAKATRKASRTVKKAATIEEEEEEREEEEEETRPKTRKSDKPRPNKKSVPRKATSKSTRKTVARVEEGEEGEEEEEEEEEPSQIPQVLVTLEEPLAIAPKSTAPRKGSRSRKTAAPPPVEEEEEYESIPEEKQAPLRKSTLGKATRSKKPSRSKKPPAPSPEEDEPEEEEATLRKSTLSKKPSRSKKVTAAPPVDVGDESEEQAALRKSTLSKKPSRSKKAAATPPEEEEPEELEEEPAALGRSTKSRKPSRAKKVVATPTPTPPTEEDDVEIEPPRQSTRKAKPRSKSTARKTQLEPSPPPPPAELTQSDDEEPNEPVISNRLIKSKKSVSEFISKQPEGVKEVEELIIPNKNSKAKNTRPALEVAEEPEDIMGEEQEREEKTEPEKRVIEGVAERSESSTEENQQVKEAQVKKVAKGKDKQVESDAEEESPPAPKPPKKKKTAKPKSTTKSVVKEDGDVEMEEAPHGTSIPNISPKTAEHIEEVTRPVSQPEPEVGADFEMDIQTDLEPTQESIIEVDEAMSFAPRLVTKSSSLQPRGQTPELIPIPSFPLPSQLETKPTIPADPRPGQPSSLNNLTAPVWTLAPEPVVATAPISSFPHSTPISTSNINGGAQHLSSSQVQQEPPEETIPDFTPFLSKLPFMPLQSLSEAELDMTVEEWIRYQMEVEYDKFKRDGERQLLGFRQKAEEVRKVIEGL